MQSQRKRTQCEFWPKHRTVRERMLCLQHYGCSGPSCKNLAAEASCRSTVPCSRDAVKPTSSNRSRRFVHHVFCCISIELLGFLSSVHLNSLGIFAAIRSSSKVSVEDADR